MHKNLLIVFVVAFSILLIGCFSNLENSDFQTSNLKGIGFLSSDPSDLRIALYVPKVSPKNVKPDIKSSFPTIIEGKKPEIEATLTLVNSIEKTSAEIKKIFPVSSAGKAEIFFPSLPPVTIVAQIKIKNGNIAGFSEFRGAADLEAGKQNTVFLAPNNSFTKADILAELVLRSIHEPRISHFPARISQLIENTISLLPHDSAASFYDEGFNAVVDSLQTQNAFLATVSPDVRILSNPVITNLISISNDGNELRFYYDPDIEQLTPNQFIVAEENSIASMGILKRVINVVSEGNELIVNTTPASLDEIFQESNFNIFLDSESFLSAEQMANRHLSSAFGNNHRSSIFRPNVLTSMRKKIQLAPTVEVDLTYCRENGILFKFRKSLNGSMNFNLGWKELASLEAILKIDSNADLKANDLEVFPPVEKWVKIRIPTSSGMVPVFFRVSIAYTGDFLVTSENSWTGGFSSFTNSFFGIAYDEALSAKLKDRFTRFGFCEKTMNWITEKESQVSAKIQVGPKLDFYIPGQAVVSMKVKTVAEAKYQPEKINTMRVDGSSNIEINLKETEWLKFFTHNANEPVGKISFAWNLFGPILIYPNQLTGKLIGKTVDAKTQEAISEVKVIAIIASQTFGITTSGSDGFYQITLPCPATTINHGEALGTYVLKFEKEGYKSDTLQKVEVKPELSTFLEPFRLHKKPTDGSQLATGTIMGLIHSSATGEKITGVSVRLRIGKNNFLGSIFRETISDENGKYSFVDVEVGEYSLEFIKEMYSNTLVNVTCNQNTLNEFQNASLNPIVGGGILRIVLDWGINPQDLDAHFTGPASSGERFHVSWVDKTYSENEEKVASLDVDDVTSYGPETITLFKQDSGKIYRYSVHHFSGRSNLSDSNAKVRVFRGTDLVATFYPPSGAHTAKDVWTVFELTDLEITPINTISPLVDDQSVSSIRSSKIQDIDAELINSLPAEKSVKEKP